MLRLTLRLDGDRQVALHFLVPDKEFLETYIGVMGACCERAERAALEPAIVQEGWLEKEGGGTSLFGNKDWKPRYFRLARHLFSYSEVGLS